MVTSIRIILDTRREKKDGSFPIKLRVIIKTKTYDYTSVFSLTREMFQSFREGKKYSNLQAVFGQLEKLERDANAFARSFSPFSLHHFEVVFMYGHSLIKQRSSWVKTDDNPILNFDYSPYLKRFPIFKEDHMVDGCISVAYLSYIKRLLQEDRLGSALTYQTSYSAIKRFKGNVRLCDITPAFLFQFEKWMLDRGRTLGTVSIQLRPLRSIFNDAIALGQIDKKYCYPFGRRKYIIPKARRKKKAIDIEEIGSIYYYQPENADEEKARDFWIFCYLANGMNMKDVAELKYRNIEEDCFTFIRAKTALATRGDPREVSVYLTDDLKSIIEKWGNSDTSPANYVFPIYQPGSSVYDKHYACRAFIRLVNDRMKKIAVKLGIEQKVTTVISRHSFSTQLKRAGASTEFIQEALGHTDIRTTEYYLGSFEKSVKKEFAEALTAFKKKDDSVADE